MSSQTSDNWPLFALYGAMYSPSTIGLLRAELSMDTDTGLPPKPLGTNQSSETTMTKQMFPTMLLTFRPYSCHRNGEFRARPTALRPTSGQSTISAVNLIVVKPDNSCDPIASPCN